MRKFIGLLFTIGGLLLGLYVGLWLMFVKPIMDVCLAIDNNAISAVIVGIAIIKCVLAGFIGWVIAYIGIMIGGVISGSGRMRKRR